jgi:glycosyltransferase involved in cell wall biosynthesis
MSPAGISLVCTVRDEADNIADLLESMLAQTRPADEIVINDCGSRDATAAIVRQYIDAGQPIRLVAGGYNIPSGRNNAIAQARHDLIACTDAGLTLDPAWLERIIAPIEQDRADIVGGFYQAAPHGTFERALAATNYRDGDEIDAEQFVPFGKSCAFRRAAWLDVAGYPEWASHCEDVIFAQRLRHRGWRFAFVIDALVHFRPRATPQAFARQYLLYARGDGVAGLWPRRHLIRYATYITAGILAGIALRWPLAWLPLAGGAAAYLRAPFRRLHRHSGGAPAWQAIAWLPAIRLIGDLAKMAGYPIGRLRRRMVPGLAAAVARDMRPPTVTAGQRGAGSRSAARQAATSPPPRESSG